MSKYDVTGQTFGYLTVLGRDESSIGQRNSKWLCRCKCGKVTSVTRCSLVSGHTVSCGCKLYESHNRIHGMTGTRIHSIWASMNDRCRNGHNKSKSYTERGITVCEEWKRDFMAFFTWSMDNGYSDNLTIDRIDNDKGYSPDNCRWITIEAQQANKSNTIRILYNGEERCLRTICEEIGFPYKTAHKRYKRMSSKRKPITQEKLFEPIHTEKISFKFRHP